MTEEQPFVGQNRWEREAFRLGRRYQQKLSAEWLEAHLFKRKDTRYWERNIKVEDVEAFKNLLADIERGKHSN